MDQDQDREKTHGAESAKRKLTGVKWFFFNLSTLTAIFLYALDNTVVANIQPVIVSRFDAVDRLPWLSAIVALYVVSGVLWILPMLQQAFTILTNVEHRMFPVHLLRNREAILLCLLACCGGSIAYITVYYIPLYYQFTRGDSAIKTAERILPLIFLLIFGMLSNGYLMSKSPNIKNRMYD